MGLSVSPVFLSGAFCGITALIFCLSLLIGQAYRERMLWWHAATLGVGLLAHLAASQGLEALPALFGAVQMALALHTLRVTLGHDGAVRGASRAAAWLVALIALFVPLQGVWPGSFLTTLPLWAATVSWYLVRAWPTGTPWIQWLAVGQLAWALQGVAWIVTHWAALDAGSPLGSAVPVAGLAALALAASAIYLAMVWRSRLLSENELRVQARDKVDPLTGFVMPRVFFRQVNDAQVRSLNLKYASVMLLVRLQNLEQIVQERDAENSESIVLAAAQAIASSLRSHDIGARISGNRFGVLAEGVSASHGASELATRILAHGLRGDDYGLPGSEMKFQIAAIEISNLGLDVSLILKGLEDALTQMAAQPGGPAIRILPGFDPALTTQGTLLT
jgi:GGDEF domain-containing protein